MVLFINDDISVTPKMKTLALIDYSIGVLFNTNAQNIFNENKSAYTRLFFISRKYFCTIDVLESMDKQLLIDDKKKRNYAVAGYYSLKTVYINIIFFIIIILHKHH